MFSMVALERTNQVLQSVASPKCNKILNAMLNIALINILKEAKPEQLHHAFKHKNLLFKEEFIKSVQSSFVLPQSYVVQQILGGIKGSHSTTTSPENNIKIL